MYRQRRLERWRVGIGCVTCPKRIAGGCCTSRRACGRENVLFCHCKEAQRDTCQTGWCPWDWIASARKRLDPESTRIYQRISIHKWSCKFFFFCFTMKKCLCENELDHCENLLPISLVVSTPTRASRPTARVRSEDWKKSKCVYWAEPRTMVMLLARKSFSVSSISLIVNRLAWAAAFSEYTSMHCFSIFTFLTVCLRAVPDGSINSWR